MKSAILAGLLTIFAAVASQAADTPANLDGTKLVDAAGAKAAMEAGAKVFDVRVAVEFNEEHIKGATSVPYKESSKKEVGFNASEDKFEVEKLGAKDAAIVIYCNGPECWKSYKASVAAVKAGYKNISWFRTGIPAWKKSGFPTEK